MRVRLSGFGVLAVAVLLGSCSGPDPGLECGTGTVRSGNTCVAAASGGASAGGSSSADGGTQNTAGTTNESGAGGENSAGTSAGGNSAGGSPNTAGASGAGGSSGAAGGSGGAVGGGGAGGGGAGGGPTAEWLVFDHTDGLFAYNADTFPVLEFAQIGSTTASPVAWSPDGTQFLYADGGNLYVVDMITPIPGMPRLLAANPPLSQVTWSGDSRSVAMPIGEQLVVFDPSTAAPDLNVVSDTASLYLWAPSGNHMVYADEEGTFVVEVEDGVPGVPHEVGDPLETPDYGLSAGWSPDGTTLLVSRQGLVVWNFAGAVPTSTSLSQVSGAGIFNKAGTRMVLQEGDAPDIYYVGLNGTPPADPTLVHGDLEAGVYALHPTWSYDDWLFCHTDNPQTDMGSAYVVNLGGAVPAPPVDLGIYLSNNVANNVTWLHDSTGLVVQQGDLLSLVAFTQAGANTVPLVTETEDSIFFSRLSPTDRAFAYRAGLSLKLLDLDNPGSQPTSVSFDTGFLGHFISGLEWSASGRFIAVQRTESGRYTMLVMRVDGITASSPFPLRASSTASTRFAWQPSGIEQ